MSRWCPGCELELNETRFGRNASREDGMTVYCKLCSNRAVRESRIRRGVVQAGRGVGRPRGSRGPLKGKQAMLSKEGGDGRGGEGGG